MSTNPALQKAEVLRSVSINQILRLKDWVREKINGASIAELELRLVELDKIFTVINNVQMEIEMLSEEELSSSTRATFEENYFMLKPTLQVALTKAKDALATPIKELPVHIAKNNIVKLPKIEIKTFSGDYTKWLEFNETFEKLVHENDTLTDIAKFQYLRSSLCDQAARSIDSLELTANNYIEARKILSERFNNKKIICQEHIRKLFAIKPVDRPTSNKLRELIDDFNSHLRALNTLGRPTIQWDDLLVHMLISKLDSDTQSKWNDESNQNRLDTLDEVFKFLTKRSHLLESTPLSKSMQHIQPKHNASSPRQSFVTYSSQRFCEFCKQNSHLIYKCNRFLGITVAERQRHVNQLNLCTNCLKAGHNIQQCTTQYVCRHCYNRHHTLLHDKDTPCLSNALNNAKDST